MSEDAQCRADVQNESDGSLSGSMTGTGTASPASCASCQLLAESLARLTATMEQQNEALWALVNQTVSLISVLVETDEGEDSDAPPTTYLDGSPIR